MRQAHGAEAQREDRGVRRVDRVLAAAEAAERLGSLGAAGRGHVQGRRAAPPPQGEEDEGGMEIAVSLSQYWMAWTRVIDRIPPAVTLARTTTATMRLPSAGARAGDRAERDLGTLELWQEIEPLDADDQQGRESADLSGLQPRLGEVGEVYAPDRRSGAATSTSRTTYPTV